MEELLAKYGWVVECESPLEIRHNDGSFASGQASHIVVMHYRDAAEYESAGLEKVKREFECDLWRTVLEQVTNGNRMEFTKQGKTHHCTIWVPLTVGHRGYSGDGLTMAGAFESALQSLDADPAP
jgi:hypothetical protein